jgi:hypothetical protein
MHFMRSLRNKLRFLLETIKVILIDCRSWFGVYEPLWYFVVPHVVTNFRGFSFGALM